MNETAVSRPRAAVAGVAGAAVSLAVGELLSGLSARVPSLVLGVANVVIADAPGGIVRWSIETFGTRQKPLLVIGIVVTTLALGGLIGLAGRHHPMRAIAGFAAFGILGGWAAARDVLASAAWGWVAAIAATAAGVATYLGLLRLAGPAAPAATDAAPGPARVRIGGLDRRGFVAVAGAVAVLAATTGEIGRRLRQADDVEAARGRVATSLGEGPAADVPASVASFDRQVPGISPLVTPNRDFYRIDTRILVPQVDPEGWTLRITGMVRREVELGLDDLLAMDRIDEYVTLQCVSNEVGGDLVGNALWSGVRLTDLLDRAEPLPEADQIVGRSVDGWTAGFPTDVATDGRPAMVAVAMNGEPLPVKHGFPARLVVPGLYGYVSATKWLSEIELTTWDGADGYWIPRGWAKQGPIKTQSRIDVPQPGRPLRAGPTPVAGVAWAPTRAIERVEVRIDDGPWQPARLSGALSRDTWVQWLLTWDAPPGRHRIEVRATDGTGETQTADVAPPPPSGATGHHTIGVDVT
jgi:DMSO/TMAO reductase YedYZ molybdopterin-dependent catalytic subunit